MNILGTYNSTLSDFYYQELLNLYQDAVSLGEFVQALPSDQINQLKDSSIDFTSLPVPSAGQVATDDAFNNPVTVLASRLTAINSEIARFSATIASYISLVNKEISLLDKLLAGADLEVYKGTRPVITGAIAHDWDFRIGPGTIDPVSVIDPVSAVKRTTSADTYYTYKLATGVEIGGLQPVRPDRSNTVKELTWQFDTDGENEQVSGPDWSSLSILEVNPRVVYSSVPDVKVLLPNSGSINGVFNIIGNPPGGVLPVYVSIGFTPRRNFARLRPTNVLPDQNFFSGGWTLNGWSIDTTTFPTIGWVAKSTNTSGILTSGVLRAPVTGEQLIYVRINVQNSLGADGFLQLNVSFRDATGAQINLIPVRSVGPLVGAQIVSGVVTVPNNPAIVQAVLQVTLTNNTTGNWYVYRGLVYTPQLLSKYVVSQDQVSVYTLGVDNVSPVKVLTVNTDYIVDSLSQITFLEVSANLYGIRFTEAYPSYSCSIDENQWSPTIMLDPYRLYPDDDVSLIPIDMGIDTAGNRTLFPLTDELGNSLGMYLQMTGTPQYEYELLVSGVASPAYGVSATLEIDLTKTSYINSISISPVNAYPMILKAVRIEGLTSSATNTVFMGNYRIDKPVELFFNSQITRKVYLDVVQDNYSLKTHTVDPSNKLRRDTLSKLQAVLPFSSRRIIPNDLIYYSGAQYDFALGNIAVYQKSIDVSELLISGPYRFNGILDVLHYHVELYGTVTPYLTVKVYSALGAVLQYSVNLTLTPNSAVPISYGGGVRAQAAYVDISITYALNSVDACVGIQSLQGVLTNA